MESQRLSHEASSTRGSKLLTISHYVSTWAFLFSQSRFLALIWRGPSHSFSTRLSSPHGTHFLLFWDECHGLWFYQWPAVHWGRFSKVILAHRGNDFASELESCVLWPTRCWRSLWHISTSDLSDRTILPQNTLLSTFPHAPAPSPPPPPKKKLASVTPTKILQN